MSESDHSATAYSVVFFLPRIQKERVQGQAGHRHHGQLCEPQHHSGGESGGDQRCGLHLQPEVLPGA